MATTMAKDCNQLCLKDKTIANELLFITSTTQQFITADANIIQLQTSRPNTY